MTKTTENTTAKCPVCGRPAELVMKPFCSRRCADQDLQRWLTGGYAIPASEDDEDGDGAPLSADRESD